MFLCFVIVTTSAQPITADVLHMHPPQNITSEIDSIMEKIEQDNRVLAELDKSRYTIGRLVYMKHSSSSFLFHLPFSRLY